MATYQRFSTAPRRVLCSHPSTLNHFSVTARVPLLRAGVATSGNFKLPGARNEDNVSHPHSSIRTDLTCYSSTMPKRLQRESSLMPRYNRYVRGFHYKYLSISLAAQDRRKKQRLLLCHRSILKNSQNRALRAPKTLTRLSNQH